MGSGKPCSSTWVRSARRSNCLEWTGAFPVPLFLRRAQLTIPWVYRVVLDWNVDAKEVYRRMGAVHVRSLLLLSVCPRVSADADFVVRLPRAEEGVGGNEVGRCCFGKAGRVEGKMSSKLSEYVKTSTCPVPFTLLCQSLARDSDGAAHELALSVRQPCTAQLFTQASSSSTPMYSSVC